MPTIEPSAFFKLSYGLFVLTSKTPTGYNGCIINTAQQITDSPKRISLCVNRSSYTNELIKRSGVFSLSVLSESAPFSLFQRFGFQSGRNVDKFEGFDAFTLGENGLPYLGSNATALFSGRVESSIDFETHTLFVAEVTEARQLSNDNSMTYDYYFKHTKPKPQPQKKKGYVCKICGYIYEGDPLPADFVCPICLHPASDFEPLD
ncbi:MAG: flavin reductase [Clostridia bacterium]|nr:flavin reductase [Clostridia bacterium]